VSFYLIHVHDDGDTEVCKVSEIVLRTPHLSIPSRLELLQVLVDYGLGETVDLNSQLELAGDDKNQFPWTRIY
jgi:hypothetical protein